MTRFSRIAEEALYLKDYFDFLNIKPNIINTKKALPFPDKIQTGFTFEDVSFKYPGSEVYAIRDLNFTLKVGEKLALVGENGAGKTTLVKITGQAL